jgi:hypothetical protein
MSRKPPIMPPIYISPEDQARINQLPANQPPAGLPTGVPILNIGLPPADSKILLYGAIALVFVFWLGKKK